MRAVFAGEPNGTLEPPTLLSTLDRIAALEERVRQLEERQSVAQRVSQTASERLVE